ncbi:bifunctional ADP-dependent NAD(P)H-hydrate dehydratase/NAD(P)H-hydrate epimerase [Synechocystis sp. PCC 7509]|uniref:bifunctional ADP-dependent NAD(P)H-hydrate dehydratase/NAD(P)H-hydrate epimerase n=1 Tax=Synechocystis sp. PCC 7509 TaxID=927677 RepID=UPI0002AC0842|nr:bifunctional ADP-dependent NAD(P)H-hydrate dehydratase/NAD(P)H-hydrate epimerase [Synechocystis sp. PCC 7509]
MDKQREIEQFVVSAQQMRDIEGRIFAAGMPVAALMEKVGLAIARKFTEMFQTQRIGVLVGSGHNGGDALVVARELYYRGYKVVFFSPFSKYKDLTASHAQYVESLGIERCDSIEKLLNQSDVLIEGLFGFGLERDIMGDIAKAISSINQSSLPVISLDLPSGLHTDTGEVLGIAIKATYTFCLGLWKLGLLQDCALDYVGKAQLIDFDIPVTDIYAVLGETPKIKRITTEFAIALLPLRRPPVTHKYKQGHLLLICGSTRYAGGAILTGLGARASGVGMLSIAVPESLKPLLVAQLPEALIIGCPETELGAIAQLQLPAKTNLDSFDAISCGPGLTFEATPIIQEVLGCNCPLILDADGLNILAELGTTPTLAKRQGKTILTPHTGEFKRLFPDLGALDSNESVINAAKTSKAVVLLKGARTTIASPDGLVWINPESTPALARGGSGDVLTGLMGGLVAQQSTRSLEEIAAVAAWWHSQAGIKAAANRTQMGVDAYTLTQYLLPFLADIKC